MKINILLFLIFTLIALVTCLVIYYCFKNDYFKITNKLNNKVLLVTICIGDKYLDEYNKLFRNSQEFYAKKNNYDFKIIKEFNYNEFKNYHINLINFHKVLLCNYDWSNNYDYIIFVDADIIINKNSPSIHNYYKFTNKIGICDEMQPDISKKKEVSKYKGWEKTAKEYYKLHANLNLNTNYILNTGVLVFQPKIHKYFLSNLKKKYEKIVFNQKKNLHKDQPFIGYELQINKLDYLMDYKWNAIWVLYKTYYNNINKKVLTLQEFYNNNYFIHFAGHTDYNLIKDIKM
jgi:hypothetical protein